MAATQSDKAARFRALHEGPGAFVIPNPWDAGSARILAALGFQALATSSGASAGTLGRRDGTVTREEALAHARAIVEATDLPVSADLEKGFDSAAHTARTAARSGRPGAISTSAPAFSKACRRAIVSSRLGLPRKKFSVRAVSVNGNDSARAACTAAATRSVAWPTS